MSECVVRMDIDEMPTACGPCNLSCTAICKEWTKVDRKEIGHTKSPNCPILAILPKGHGRLVDADALKAWFFRPYSNEESYCNMDVAKAIDKAPTIVPAERSET